YLLAAHLDDRWVEIPLGDKVDDTLQTDEGGGCTLRDFMFIKTDAGPLMVREYKREFGRGYDAAMPVHVTTYDLHSNEAEWPSLRFKHSFSSTPSGIYCAVRSLMR